MEGKPIQGFPILAKESPVSSPPTEDLAVTAGISCNLTACERWGNSVWLQAGANTTRNCRPCGAGQSGTRGVASPIGRLALAKN